MFSQSQRNDSCLCQVTHIMLFCSCLADFTPPQQDKGLKEEVKSGGVTTVNENPTTTEQPDGRVN